MSRVQGVPLDSYLKRIQACKSQDSAGGIGRILRVVPNTESPCCRDRLPTQMPVPIAAEESWDLQPLPLGQWKFECKVVALSVLCPHPRREENRRDRFEHRGSQLSMFVRSFSPFPTSTGAELHGECTTVECRPPRMSLCFQAIDRFCSTFALIIISKKRHKSRRYGGRWCAGIG